MLRKSARVSGRLVVSAAISWTLIPIAVADAPSTGASPASSAAAEEAKFKKLHTVPEDGIGDEHWLSGATNFVREVMTKRPNEDLVICVAGCLAKQDRVVYAQPAEPTSRQPSKSVSELSPAATGNAEAADTAASSAQQGDAEKGAFVPSMAQPENAEAPSESATEAAPETSEQPAAESSEPASTGSEATEPR